MRAQDINAMVIQVVSYHSWVKEVKKHMKNRNSLKTFNWKRLKCKDTTKGKFRRTRYLSVNKKPYFLYIFTSLSLKKKKKKQCIYSKSLTFLYQREKLKSEASRCSQLQTAWKMMKFHSMCGSLKQQYILGDDLIIFYSWETLRYLEYVPITFFKVQRGLCNWSVLFLVI